jgi:peptidylprolyl isomerase
MAKAKKGDKVKIHYVGKTKDEQEFDSSKKRNEPLDVELGKGEFFPKVEQEIEGMEPGEEKTVNITKDDAIPFREDLIFTVPKSQLSADVPLDVGVVLQVGQPGGQQALVKIVEVLDESVKLDANHPLAGQELIFEIELIEIA